MDNIFSARASGADTTATMRTLLNGLPKEASGAQLVFVFYGNDHDPACIHGLLRAHFPAARLIGGSSCLGLMTESGLGSTDAIGLLALCDKRGEYGVASARIGDDPSATAIRLLNEALKDAGAEGQLPVLVWVYQPLGSEEEVLRGLGTILNDRCPVFGGTSGADSITNLTMSQLATDGVYTDGLVVCVMLPSSPVGISFQTGFVPTGASGVITAVGGINGESSTTPGGHSRVIMEIDQRPAYHVYREWTQKGSAQLTEPETEAEFIRRSQLYPLASLYGDNEIPQYLPLFPFKVLPNGGLCVLRDVTVGERLHAMKGDPIQLIPRAGRAAAEARISLYPNSNDTVGALVVYCAASRFAVGKQISEMPAYISAALKNTPFLGAFSFGELGCLNDCNVHGNLMISVLAFSSVKELE